MKRRCCAGGGAPLWKRCRRRCCCCCCCWCAGIAAACVKRRWCCCSCCGDGGDAVHVRQPVPVSPPIRRPCAWACSPAVHPCDAATWSMPLTPVASRHPPLYATPHPLPIPLALDDPPSLVSLLPFSPPLLIALASLALRPPPLRPRESAAFLWLDTKQMPPPRPHIEMETNSRPPPASHQHPPPPPPLLRFARSSPPVFCSPMSALGLCKLTETTYHGKLCDAGEAGQLCCGARRREGDRERRAGAGRAEHDA